MEVPGGEAQTIGKLLPAFYEQYHLGKDGGVHEPKVKIEFAKYIYFFFPNWNERRRAVERHDIHHIVTGYTSTIKGEVEIGAWELSSGCRGYWAASFLDMQALSLACFFPAAAFKAFVRGQRSGNLYHDTITPEQAKSLTPAALRQQLHIPPPENALTPAVSDYLLFAGWFIWACIISLLSLVLVPVIAAYNVYVFAGLLLGQSKRSAAGASSGPLAKD